MSEFEFLIFMTKEVDRDRKQEKKVYKRRNKIPVMDSM